MHCNNHKWITKYWLVVKMLPTIDVLGFTIAQVIKCDDLGNCFNHVFLRKCKNDFVANILLVWRYVYTSTIVTHFMVVLFQFTKKKKKKEGAVRHIYGYIKVFDSAAMSSRFNSQYSPKICFHCCLLVPLLYLTCGTSAVDDKDLVVSFK